MQITKKAEENKIIMHIFIRYLTIVYGFFERAKYIEPTLIFIRLKKFD